MRIKPILLSSVFSIVYMISNIFSINANAYSDTIPWSVTYCPTPTPIITSDIISFPSYSGGYILSCTNYSGGNNSFINVNTNFGYSCIINSTDMFTISGYLSGGTTTFAFTPHSTSALFASGTIKYINA